MKLAICVYTISTLIYLLSIIANIGSAEAACQVSYDSSGATFHNGCNYTVFVYYTAECSNGTISRDNGVGPLKRGQTSYRIAWPNCRISWSWKEY